LFCHHKIPSAIQAYNYVIKFAAVSRTAQN